MRLTQKATPNHRGQVGRLLCLSIAAVSLLFAACDKNPDAVGPSSGSDQRTQGDSRSPTQKATPESMITRVDGPIAPVIVDTEPVVIPTPTPIATPTRTPTATATPAPIPTIFGAEKYPGIIGDGTNHRSNGTSVGSSIEMKWKLNWDNMNLTDLRTQNPPDRAAPIRMKNIMVRDKTIALLTPGLRQPITESQELSLIDLDSGLIKRRTIAPEGYSSGNEFDSGNQGHDLRFGQLTGYWHPNGFIYLRGGGDGMTVGRIRVSDGEYVYQRKVGVTPTLLASPGANFLNWDVPSSNGSGYFAMADNSNWLITPPAGHNALKQDGTTIRSLDGSISQFNNSGSGADPKKVNYFTWGGAYLMDESWIYALGTTAHPTLPWAEWTRVGPEPRYNARCNWIGARVRAHRLTGQTNTTTSMRLVEPYKDGYFVWEDSSVFIGNESNYNSAQKPWTIGDDNIFLVVQDGLTALNLTTSPGPQCGTVDFTKPLLLKAIDRSTGQLAFSKTLPITGAGSSLDWLYDSYTETLWAPQIAYLNRVAVDGREYVAVMLPEQAHGTDPYGSAAASNTRLAVVDAQTQASLWSYQYPRGGTTPNRSDHINNNTKMFIAGNELWVAWIKPSGWPAGTDYIALTGDVYPMTLQIDRFALATGTKTSFSFPLGVSGNTFQLDDIVIVDGKILVLATYREWTEYAAFQAGAQILVALGSTTPAGSVPAITQVATASPSSINLATAHTVNLSVAATVSSGELNYVWNKLSGPGPVTFSTNGTELANSTAASFVTEGTYTLECRIHNGAKSTTSTVNVTVSPPVTKVSMTLQATTVAEGGSVDIILTRSLGPTTSPLTVKLGVLPGRATEGVDFDAIPREVVIPAGATTVKVPFHALTDAVAESSEAQYILLKRSPDYVIDFVAPGWGYGKVARAVTITNVP